MYGINCIFLIMLRNTVIFMHVCVFSLRQEEGSVQTRWVNISLSGSFILTSLLGPISIAIGYNMGINIKRSTAGKEAFGFLSLNFCKFDEFSLKCKWGLFSIFLLFSFLPPCLYFMLSPWCSNSVPITF